MWAVEGYTQGGSAGQPDAGPTAGGAFSLQGGFWAGVRQEETALPDRLYLPLIFMQPVQ